MRILKYSAIILFAASATGSLQAQRPDSDLQAKAREALRQAETQADTQPPAEKAPVAPPKKMKTPPPTASKVSKAPASDVSGDADAKAREQLRRAELDAASNAPATPAVPQKTQAEMDRAEHLRQLEAARAKKEASRVTTPAAAVSAPVTATGSGTLTPDAEAKARESMRKTLSDLDSQQKTATAAAGTQGKYVAPSVSWDHTPEAVTPAATPPPAPKNVSVAKPASATPAVKAKTPAAVPPPSNPSFDPGVTATVTAPAHPAAPLVAGSKEQRLADLLSRYKMDQISPSEYHQQKAKILAEP